MKPGTKNSYNSLKEINISGKNYKYFSLNEAEKNGLVQAGVGKLSFGVDKICENIETFIQTIKKSKPSGAKGTFIKKISISSTMGVSLNCEVN